MAADQAPLCRRFAGHEPNRFDGTEWHRGHFGQPLIDNALAHIECRPWQNYAGGDHTIFVGEVMRATPLQARSAAAFFKGQIGCYDS